MARERRRIIFAVAGLFAGGAVSPAATAQSASPTTTKKDKNVTAGEKEAKKLLLLMDKDQNGKVSKQEFMSFMEAEFERLDKDKSGELDVSELTQSRVRANSGINR
jgi:Ca2+-binding EF-hand superfamily protein